MSADENLKEPLLRRNEQVIWDVIDGTTALCHTEKVEFFRMNDTGAVIWELCNDCTMEELIEAVCVRYPTADRERLASLVRDYIPVLEKEGLIETFLDTSS